MALAFSPFFLRAFARIPFSTERDLSFRRDAGSRDNLREAFAAPAPLTVVAPVKAGAPDRGGGRLQRGHFAPLPSSGFR